MTPDQRFALILTMIGLVGTYVGFMGKRITNRLDKRSEQIDTLIVTNAQNGITLPHLSNRMITVEGAIAKMIDLQAESRVQIAELRVLQTSLLSTMAQQRMKE